MKNFAQISMELSIEQDGEPSPWRGSPFDWMRNLSSKAKHTVVKEMLVRWIGERGRTVTSVTAGGASYLNIDCVLMSLKISFLWTETGEFVWQQIRDADYKRAMFVGIAPFQVDIWVVPIGEMEVVPQHVASDGTPANYMVRVSPGNLPDWLTRNEWKKVYGTQA